MFQVLLAATVALGAGLLAFSGGSDDAFVSSRTAGQVIGWLCIACALAGARGLREAVPGVAVAASITLLTGALVLYVSYFEWSEASPPPRPQAVLAEGELKLIPMPAAVAPAPPRRAAPGKLSVEKKLAVEDPCFLVAGADALECRRCVNESGLRGLFCAEQARLDYCGDRHALDAATCPSPIPVSLPL